MVLGRLEIVVSSEQWCLLCVEVLPLYTWSCYPYTHGVVALIHTYTDAPLVGKGCAVIGKASVQSGPLQTGQVGSK